MTVRVSAAALLASLLLCTGWARSLDGANFQITGVVVSERGGGPVAGAHITASASGQATGGRRGFPRRGQGDDANQPSAETDAAGRFVLKVPSAGSWQVYGYAHGYRRQAFERHENFLAGVVLSATTPTYDLRFSLEPDSAISGFVLDEAGEGVRNARVALLAAEAPGVEVTEAGNAMRGATMTDDRGHYEFAELAPGEYNVEVQAQPWYAAGAPGRQMMGGGGGAAAADPVLDVVYPPVYFPGAPERSAAEAISVRHGEVRQADFHLVPIPATHLRMPLPAGIEGRGQVFPQIERVTNEGNPFVSTSIQTDTRGQIDVGGLSPGLYRVTLRGQGGGQTPSFLRVPEGAARTLDLSAAMPVCELTLRFEGAAADTGRLQVVLADVDTGATFRSYGQGGLQRRRGSPANGGGGEQPPAEDDRKLDVPPGKYRVTLGGSADVYLAGIATKGQSTGGRVVTVSDGSSVLTLKLAEGRATVRGVATEGGVPLLGAMVMLVPATFGQVDSIPVLRRDETNTDGSFLMEEVIPGDYILVAIDNGWGVNWHDSATLARYLVRGTPLRVGGGASVAQDVVALAP